MLEGEIRGKFDNLIIQMLKLICQKLFGFVPDDLQIKYKPLRTLTAEQEENVKTSKTNNILALYDRKIITASDVIEEFNQQNLMAIELDNEGMDDFPNPVTTEEVIPKPATRKTNSKFINKLFKFKNGT